MNMLIAAVAAGRRTSAVLLTLPGSALRLHDSSCPLWLRVSPERLRGLPQPPTSLKGEEKDPPQVETTWAAPVSAPLTHSHTFLPPSLAEASPPLLSGRDGTVTQKDAIVPCRLWFQPCN